MERSSQIIVITDVVDAHIPYVQRHLPKPMIVIDPRDVARTKRLTFTFQNGKQHVVYGDTELNPTSVWYRKPRKVEESSLQIAESFHDYALGALQQHTLALLTAFPNALWASDFYAMRRASDKPLQTTLAQNLGFAVPDTLFTSDEGTARAFIKMHKTCIIKPIIPFSHDKKDAHMSLYATKITQQNIPDLRGLYQSPVIFQQAIDHAFDVRVTVVGREVFAARIDYHNADEHAVRDWRLGHYKGDLQITPYSSFPRDIAEKCIAHVEKLGLTFGAIDLVVDKQGTHWFLENNPNGQWAFVEKVAGMPIGAALANMLSRGSVN